LQAENVGGAWDRRIASELKGFLKSVFEEG
jgi:hypothetical protein